MIELKESFTAHIASEEIIELLKGELLSSGGRIIYSSSDSLRAKLGSMILARLLGVAVLSKSLKKRLPAKVDIRVLKHADGNLVEVICGDNLGKLVYRDKFSCEIYSKYFQNLICNFKKACGVTKTNP